jgi:hypothetical protein
MYNKGGEISDSIPTRYHVAGIRRADCFLYFAAFILYSEPEEPT